MGRHWRQPQTRLAVVQPLSLLSAVLFAAYLIARASADCECGYAAVIDGDRHVFTDLLETDFARLHGISPDTGWVAQVFDVSRDRARGEFGETFAVENVATDFGSGLQLAVRSRAVDDMVPGGEVDSRRRDMRWGTFRASMKLTDVPGTCAAFFWYFNDTQEIDMEFLSKDFNRSNASYPVNLVLQSAASSAAGYDAGKTGNFVEANLPFDPTKDFHEYRIDLLPGRVVFYADGGGGGGDGSRPLARMDGPAVPTSPGHLALQHWSNGNKLWSGGPPREDAEVTVAYVKAYFNSSEKARQRDWEGRCVDPRAPGAVCDIPERTGRNKSGSGWFFSDGHNMTNNQTVYGKNGSSRLAGLGRWPVLGMLFLVQGWSWSLW